MIVGLVGVIGALLLGAAFLVLPGMVVDHDLGTGHVAPTDRLAAINNVRTTLLQAVASVVLFFGAHATWRQFRVSQDTLSITREGHLTEQFGWPSTSLAATSWIYASAACTRCGGLPSTRHATAMRSSQRWPRSCGCTSHGHLSDRRCRPPTPTSTPSHRWRPGAGQPARTDRPGLAVLPLRPPRSVAQLEPH